MKNKIICTIFIIIFFSIFPIFLNIRAYSDVENPESTLIKISPSQITDEYIRESLRTADILLDEQNKLPSTPIALSKEVSVSMSGQPTWMPGFQGDNVQSYIDLNGIYVITNIGYFDSNGVVDLSFSYGSPFHWTNVANVTTSSYNEWKIINLNNIETQYLRIETVSGTHSGISEIALYGYKIADVEIPETGDETNSPYFKITVDKAIGANAFIDDPLNVLEATGVVREYHNFHWTLDSLDRNKFNPSYGGKWNFDDYYRKLYEKGIIAFPCIQGISRSVLGVEGTNNKPVKAGDSTLDPISYAIHASTMFQYAARYGSTLVEDSKLLLAADQERLSGLGYLEYYENWNEQDKTWEGNDSYFSPYEYAAMTSADYDGHEGKLGDTYGIKNADINAKLVMGGLAGGERTPEYLDLMKLWFENNREDKKLAFDVINFHTYSGNISPEESNFKEVVSNVVKWRNANARDKEVWLTEYGWDSTSTSPIAAPNNETQRDWLIRSSLIALGSGINRMTMYMLRDASWIGDAGKYATSGLTTQKGAWTKKPSWYGMYTMKEVLSGYEFDDILSETENIYIYKFINKTNGDECYAIWSPTSNSSIIKDYEFNVGNKTKPMLTKLTDGYYDGIKTKLTVNDGKVVFDVTESPIFLTLSSKDNSYISPNNTKIEITSNMISVQNLDNDSYTQKLLDNYLALFDEQNKAVITPLMKSTETFNTRFDSNMKSQYYPLEGYIDLGKYYHISHIGLYDTNAVGKIAFYAGEPENWNSEPFYTNDLSTYNYWVVNNAIAETKYIKIVKYDTAYLNEVAFYGYSYTENEFDPNKVLNNYDETAELIKLAKSDLNVTLRSVDLLNGSEYSETSWNELVVSISYANLILNNPNASLEDLQNANNDLIDKISSLEKKQLPDPNPPDDDNISKCIISVNDNSIKNLIIKGTEKKVNIIKKEEIDNPLLDTELAVIKENSILEDLPNSIINEIAYSETSPPAITVILNETSSNTNKYKLIYSSAGNLDISTTDVSNNTYNTDMTVSNYTEKNEINDENNNVNINLIFMVIVIIFIFLFLICIVLICIKIK